MKILKEIIHILSSICYVLIIIYALVCIPYLFGYKPLVVLTGSMEPTYKVGSIIYYKHVPENQLKEGDAITFKMNSYVVSHRINKIDNGLYETKGDANNSVDAKRITYNDILGKDLDFNIPYLGYYVKLFKDNMYLLVIISCILLCEFIVNSICDKKKNKKEEKEDDKDIKSNKKVKDDKVDTEIKEKNKKKVEIR